MKTQLIRGSIALRCLVAAAGWFAVAPRPLVVVAQPAFYARDLPSRIGHYHSVYLEKSTGSASAAAFWARVGPSGGPHHWDFSGARNTAEEIERVDIVKASDGDPKGVFAAASYAERVTRELGSPPGWSYYRICPVEGRKYYGFNDRVANSFDPLIEFTAPTIDIPDCVEFGQRWSRHVEFTNEILGLFFVHEIEIRFASEAEADAFGSVALPNLGVVPALRIHEINTYNMVDLSWGFPLPDQRFENYYWLVPGIGKAVHLLEVVSGDGLVSLIPPELIPPERVQLRVFDTNADLPRIGNVSDLRIQLARDGVSLSWSPVPWVSKYRIQCSEALLGAEWSLAAEVEGSSWFHPFEGGVANRFFRVSANP